MRQLKSAKRLNQRKEHIEEWMATGRGSRTTNHESRFTNQRRSADHLFLRHRTILQAVKHQLGAGGNAQLVEDAEEVISYGVLAQAQLAGDLAIGEAFGDEAHHVFFALGTQVQAVCVLQVQRFGVAQRFEQVAKVLAI